MLRKLVHRLDRPVFQVLQQFYIYFFLPRHVACCRCVSAGLDILITTSRITMSTATFYNRTFKNILNLVGTRTISRGNKKANATRLQFRNFPNMETDTVIVAITAYVWIPSILLYISTTQSGARSLTIKWRCRGAVVARCQTTRGQPRDA